MGCEEANWSGKRRVAEARHRATANGDGDCTAEPLAELELGVLVAVAASLRISSVRSSNKESRWSKVVWGTIWYPAADVSR